MNLRTLLSATRRYWLTFLGVTFPLLGLGAVALYLMPLQYVSTTELLVSIQGSTTAAAYQNDGVVSGRINSYIPLLTSDVVSQRVIDKLKLPLTAPELSSKISAVNVPPSTALIDVAVTDESPDQARLLADTVANEFISYAGALETPSGEDDQKVSTTVVTAASEPKARIGELIVLGAAVVLAVLAFGAMAVWMRARRGAAVRSKHQRAVVGESVLADDTVRRGHARPDESWSDFIPDAAAADVPLQTPRTEPVDSRLWGEESEISRYSTPSAEPPFEAGPEAAAAAEVQRLLASQTQLVTPATAVDAEADDGEATARIRHAAVPEAIPKRPHHVEHDELPRPVARARPKPSIRTRLRSVPNAGGRRELRLRSVNGGAEMPAGMPISGVERDDYRSLSTEDLAHDRRELTKPVTPVSGPRHRAPTTLDDDDDDEHEELGNGATEWVYEGGHIDGELVEGHQTYVELAPNNDDGRRWVHQS